MFQFNSFNIKLFTICFFVLQLNIVNHFKSLTIPSCCIGQFFDIVQQILIIQFQQIYEQEIRVLPLDSQIWNLKYKSYFKQQYSQNIQIQTQMND
ncbi:hypothetical protein pb186bvf_005621 [Paramecium bursaria]